MGKILERFSSQLSLRIISAAAIVFSIGAVHFWGYSWKLLGSLRVLADSEFAVDFFSELMKVVVVSGIFARVAVMALHLPEFSEAPHLVNYVWKRATCYFRQKPWKRGDKVTVSMRRAYMRMYLRALDRNNALLTISAFVIFFIGNYVGYRNIRNFFSSNDSIGFAIILFFWLVLTAIYYINSVLLGRKGDLKKLLKKARGRDAIVPTILVLATTSVGASYVLGLVRAEIVENEYPIESTSGKEGVSFILGKTRNGVFVLSSSGDTSFVEFRPFSGVGVLRNQQ